MHVNEVNKKLIEAVNKADIRGCMTTYEAMRADGIKPNVLTYEILLDCMNFAPRRHRKLWQDYSTDLRESGLELTSDFHARLINFCGVSLKDFQSAYDAYNIFLMSDSGAPKPFVTMMSLCEKCRRWLVLRDVLREVTVRRVPITKEFADEACNIFITHNTTRTIFHKFVMNHYKVVTGDLQHIIKILVVLLSKVSELGKNVVSQDLITVFEKQKSNNNPMNLDVHEQIMVALCRVDQVPKAEIIYKSIKDYFDSLNQTVYLRTKTDDAFVLACMRIGDFEKALMHLRKEIYTHNRSISFSCFLSWVDYIPGDNLKYNYELQQTKKQCLASSEPRRCRIGTREGRMVIAVMEELCAKNKLNDG